MEGFGAINWWGFSPALDLLSQAPGEGNFVNVNLTVTRLGLSLKHYNIMFQ